MKSFVTGLLIIMYAACVAAEPLPESKVPDPLKPWIEWVLHGQEEIDCPLIYNSVANNICSWPSELELDFESRKAMFSQKWEVYSEGLWVQLPGNSKFWPALVEVNGEKWMVGKKNGNPAIFLENSGVYTVTGVFNFDHRPEWIQIPKQSGLLSLKVSGQRVDFPHLDKMGRLWLKPDKINSAKEKMENQCRIEVHRLIKDTIPMEVVTNLDLYISGNHRNIDLGSIGVQNFTPVKLESRLPVKIDQNGKLVIQAKPGKWKVKISVLHNGIAKSLSQTSLGSFNTAQEIWSFKSYNHLRIVDIKGPAQIDPQQTTMPEQYKSLPAYLINQNTKVQFVEKKRGDPHPAPDKLDIKRILWLDFGGKGFSVKDYISGNMTTGWRLAVNPPVEPGKIMLNGKEQFITKLDDNGKAGIEMRYGSVKMTAESRINKTGAIPVAGWDRDFNSAKGEINLPPGWSLFDASGIDNIDKTWLKSWSLLDLFLVLIISLGIVRLISLQWGGIALIVLVLIEHESGAPSLVFLNILAAVALLKVVPKSRIYSLINNYRLICIASLIIISLPFMVNQIKHSIYPQLEYPWRAMDRTLQGSMQKTSKVNKIHKTAPVKMKTSSHVEQRLVKPGIVGKMKEDGIRGKSYITSYSTGASSQRQALLSVKEFDSNAQIQTGAGMPVWTWNKVRFAWNGPVKKDEIMKFVFISPQINMLLGFIRVILLGLLIYGVSGVKFSKQGGFDCSNLKTNLKIGLKPGLKTNLKDSLKTGINTGGLGIILLMFICLFTAIPANADSSFPSDKLLNELKLKLIENKKPDCAPDCAVSPRMKIDINSESLSIAMEVHTLYNNIAVPLPGKAMHWLPASVLIDGKSVSSLYRDPETGFFWVRLSKGIHTIKLAGILPLRNSVQLDFLLKPNHADIAINGWSVDGLQTNGVVDNQLLFTRKNIKKSESKAFEAALLPSFVEITRIFHLGLTWKIETFVQRKTPARSAVVIQFPLIKGESVISDFPVKNGKVEITLAPKQKQARWVSSLEKSDELLLKAAETLHFSEIWKLNIGTMWHSKIKGIPVIHHQNSNGKWFPEFRPWPNEKISVKLSRPKGVEGQTYTIQRSVLELSPGKRITNAQLNLIIESSRGDQHTILLPKESKLQQLLINNKSQPVNQNDDRVTFPIVPGRQNIKLLFRTPNNTGFVWKTPQIDLKLASVNSYTFVKMPVSRWILFCTGPSVGPAVLFWSSLFVLILVSFGLGKLKITPLKGYHWFFLGLGLTQASILTLLPVVVWLIALGLRAKNGKDLSDSAFDFVQVILPVLTAIAITVLFYGIQNGLLRVPDMQISGNGSYDHHLKWYQDISDNTLPQPVIFSLPMTLYRVLILAWAMWIAFALIKWLRWGWECYSSDGLWRKINFKRKRKPVKDESPLKM